MSNYIETHQAVCWKSGQDIMASPLSHFKKINKDSRTKENGHIKESVTTCNSYGVVHIFLDFQVSSIKV